MRRRAQARGDRHFEVVATQGLGFIAQRKGDVVRAAALYESVLPLIERERNPEMYADLRSQLGDALIALGEFDRALMLHAEALELFAARGDDSRTARELAALAAIQFRTGNLERALATIESAHAALPAFARPGRARRPRCASPATPPPSSAATTWRSITCTTRNDSIAMASTSSARAC